MTLRLYNSLSRRREVFAPLDPARIGLYVCGPTVYDHAHIGNARPVIVFDLLYRLLRHLAGTGLWDGGFGRTRVIYVRNITDVDDKINARAAQEFPDLPINDAIAEITARTTGQFHRDMAALGVLPPDVEPTCTSHIPQMIAFIEKLLAKDAAYEAEGHVLLDTGAVAGYGRLSGRSRAELLDGARVEVAPYKKDAADSVLWKPSDAGQPGWDSPWGRGRPGWHIECSAMARAHLGETFDIHGGGIDLLFPHHENELAQSCAAHDSEIMAKYWMHNGYLRAEGRKMSKSLGNFVTIHQLLREWPGEVLRFNMLRTHYRQPIDWTVHGLKESWRILRNLLSRLDGLTGHPRRIEANALAALCDDLNTPQLMTALHQLDGQELADSLAMLGFKGDLDPPEQKDLEPARIEALLAERQAARARRDFAAADRIRETLAKKGIKIADHRDPQTGKTATRWEFTPR